MVREVLYRQKARMQILLPEYLLRKPPVPKIEGEITPRTRKVLLGKRDIPAANPTTQADMQGSPGGFYIIPTKSCKMDSQRDVPEKLSDQ